MPRGLRVSFRRPFIGETPFVGKKWIYWEEPLAQWLGRLEIGVEWATLVDLHEDPRLLDAYAMVVSTGHAEYFSQEMYDRLQAFIARGGNAAFFSGNNCWWRIRIEDGGDTMVCYKKEAFDPAALKTINWTEQESGALVGTTLPNRAVGVAARRLAFARRRRRQDRALRRVRAGSLGVRRNGSRGGRRVRNFRRRRHGGRLRDRCPDGGTRRLVERARRRALSDGSAMRRNRHDDDPREGRRDVHRVDHRLDDRPEPGPGRMDGRRSDHAESIRSLRRARRGVRHRGFRLGRCTSRWTSRTAAFVRAGM